MENLESATEMGKSEPNQIEEAFPPTTHEVLFAQESLDKIKDDVLPLLEEHYREVAPFKDIPLDPDFALYKSWENMGNLRIFTIRSESEGNLVGYGVFLLRSSPYSQCTLQATQDILFIYPKYRDLCGEFLTWCVEQLKQDGPVMIFSRVAVQSDFCPVLEKMGFQENEITYVMRVN